MTVGNVETSWDPLEGALPNDQEIVSAAKKREIRNILKSYVGAYDSFSELIQNAMDAVERRAAEAGESYKPKIKIIVNLQENSLEVVDNGCGFQSDQFRSFLAPSISFKGGGGTRGNKGVGATYIAYGFNDLTIRTKNSDFTEQRRIRNGRSWVEDQEGTVNRPKAEITENDSLYFNSVDQGSSFKIRFGGENTRPKDLKWYQATTATQWLYLLLIKTPLGHISLPDGKPSAISFNLVVIGEDGEEDKIDDLNAKYKFPHDEIAASQSLEKIVEAQKVALEKQLDPSTSIKKYKNSNGVYLYMGPEEIAAEKILTENELELVKEYKISAYGYFAYSTEVWDQLNDKKAGLRKGYRVLRGGLQLANNGMSQGELITIPLNKSIGHQNQTHVIVHFQDADPDLGRKGFQPDLKEVAEKISVRIVRKLSARRDILKSDSGAQAEIEKEAEVHDWLRNQEKHEEDCPLVLTNDNFFLPTKKISIGSIPLSEQDVIVLFNQLIAGGVIRGINLLATSQVAKYDGVFRYKADEPLENHIFDEKNNPLGVLAEQLTKAYVSKPKILEYKFSLDGLVREIEAGIKSAEEIDLAIFWDIGTEYEREFEVNSVLHFDNVHQRRHHGLTHIFTAGHAQFDAICLKELIELLNDPKSALEHQSKAYGLEI